LADFDLNVPTTNEDFYVVRRVETPSGTPFKAARKPMFRDPQESNQQIFPSCDLRNQARVSACKTE